MNNATQDLIDFVLPVKNAITHAIAQYRTRKALRGYLRTLPTASEMRIVVPGNDFEGVTSGGDIPEVHTRHGDVSCSTPSGRVGRVLLS